MMIVTVSANLTTLILWYNMMQVSRYNKKMTLKWCKPYLNR